MFQTRGWGNKVFDGPGEMEVFKSNEGITKMGVGVHTGWEDYPVCDWFFWWGPFSNLSGAMTVFILKIPGEKAIPRKDFTLNILHMHSGKKQEFLILFSP